MLKRTLSFVLVCLLVVSLFPLGIFAQTEVDSETRMKEGLVAHWDFEGSTLEEKLSDKATGGTVADNLVEYYPNKGTEGVVSPIKVANGVANIPHDTGVYLAANNSADLHSVTEYTIFTRFSMSGEPSAFMDFIYKNGFIRMYINNKGNAGDGDYALEFRQNGSGSYVFYAPTNVPVKANEMISLAVTAKIDAEKNITIVVYLSNDGKNYSATEPVTFSGLPNTFIGANSSTNDASVFALGKATPNATDRFMDFVMEDVRFYNVALTANEVASIKMRMDAGLVAHWNFDGETLEEKLSDKATGGTVADSLVEYYPNKGNEGVTSPIKVADGVAEIPHDTGVYLAANNSTDLHSVTEYTIFSRFSMSGTPNAWMDFIYKNGFIRMYINHTGNAGEGDYALEFRQNGSGSYTFRAPTNVPVKANEMISLAVTAKIDAEKNITIVVYLSTDGLTYTATDPVTFSGLPNTFIGANSSTNDASVFALGKATPNATDRKMDFVFEDVRFYNIALTAEEVGRIQFEATGEAPGEEVVLGSWNFDELRGTTVTDSIGGKTATLNNASFEAGINGNGVRLDASKNGSIDFGERGLVSLIEGKDKYSISMWIMPSYYGGKQTMRLMTIGADENGNALLDIHWAKNNAVERPGISVIARSSHADNATVKTATYSLPESAIPNLGYMSSDKTNTLAVWQLLTVTVNVASGQCVVYINNEKLISANLIFSQTTLQSGTLALLGDSIGYNAAVPDVMAFNGVVDELRVYDGILSTRQIAKIVETHTDTTSPTADQKLVDALITRMGTAAVLYRGSGNALYQGEIVKLDPSDYTLTTYFKKDKVYVPKAFALSYFSLDTVETGEDGYVNLTALCETLEGYELYYNFAEKLAIITPTGVATFTGDDVASGGYTNKQYRDRMVAFFNNDLMPEPTTDTEQSRVVVYTSEEFEKYVYSPSICTLNGVLYAACDIKSEYTLVFRSKDNGATWEQIGNIDKMRCATLFAYNNQLYLLGLYITTATDSMGICGTRSLTDESVSWTPVSTIHVDYIEKSGHCSSTPVLIANGRIYKAFEDGNIWAEEGSSMGTKKAFVLSCDLNENILNGSKWTVSNYITITADWVKEQIGTTTTAHHGTPALEGNMVQGPDGKIYNILRLNCEPANGYAVRLELSADGKTLSYATENATIKFPGGENKFNIRYDEATGYYMALVNNNTASYWPMQRNVLSLTISKDLVNWEVVETVLVDRTMLNFDVSMALHGFQYVDWCVDGDDIVFTVRETMGESQIYHNGYELTFYRISDYKNLLPEDASTTTPTDPTDPDGSGDETSDTTPTTSTTPNTEKSGCKSSIVSYQGIVLVMLLVASALLVKRKQTCVK